MALPFITSLDAECPRCGGPCADEPGGYCFNCLCSYRRYFGYWPSLTPKLKLIFNQQEVQTQKPQEMSFARMAAEIAGRY